MYLHTLLEYAFLASTISAAPHPQHSEQQLAKRATPIFDLFAANDPNQATLMAAIPDAIQMARLAQDRTTWQSIYDKYFPTAVQAQVAQVFNNIVPDPVNNPTVGSANLANARFNGLDLMTFSARGSSCALGSWAYSIPFPLGFGILYPPAVSGSTSVYVCPLGYTLPNLASSIDCDSLGTETSDAMDFLGATILHEWMHNPLLGAAATGNPITDYNGQAGYGPDATLDLLQDNPDACITNADSFTWLALEIYWSNECAATYQAPSSALSAVTCYHAADPDGAEGYCPFISDQGWCDCGDAGLFPMIPSDQPASPCGYTVAPDMPAWSPPTSNCGWYPSTPVDPTCGPYDVSTTDAAAMVSNLTSYGNDGYLCCSDGTGGCSNVVDTDGVALDLCADTTDVLCTDCSSLATLTSNFASTCVSGGLIGGTQAVVEAPGLLLEL